MKRNLTKYIQSFTKKGPGEIEIHPSALFDKEGLTDIFADSQPSSYPIVMAKTTLELSQQQTLML